MRTKRLTLEASIMTVLLVVLLSSMVRGQGGSGRAPQDGPGRGGVNKPVSPKGKASAKVRRGSSDESRGLKPTVVYYDEGPMIATNSYGDSIQITGFVIRKKDGSGNWTFTPIHPDTSSNYPFGIDNDSVVFGIIKYRISVPDDHPDSFLRVMDGYIIGKDFHFCHEGPLFNTAAEQNENGACLGKAGRMDGLSIKTTYGLKHNPCLNS